MKGAPTSRVSAQVSKQTHAKNFLCITETTFKPSPPSPAAASQPQPGPCWNPLHIPRGQAASRGEFTCPSLTKEWDYGCKTAPPFLQPLLPDSRLPEHPRPGWGPLILLPRQLPPPERACSPRAAPGARGGWGEPATSRAKRRCRSESAAAARAAAALADPAARPARKSPLARRARRRERRRSRPPPPCAFFSLPTARTPFVILALMCKIWESLFAKSPRGRAEPPERCQLCALARVQHLSLLLALAVPGRTALTREQKLRCWDGVSACV